MTLEQLENGTIEALVDQCERYGRTFADVRRVYGDETYRTVRDECVRRGRGTAELTATEVDGVLVATVE